MAMKKRYHTVNGMLIGETSNGVRRGYLSDALGSVVATVDDTGSIENTYRYKPYGDLLAKTGTASDPRFLWIGALGYRYKTSLGNVYVRARHYVTYNGNWSSVDKFWPAQPAYNYARSNPVTHIDPSGDFPFPIILPLPLLLACSWITSLTDKQITALYQCIKDSALPGQPCPGPDSPIPGTKPPLTFLNCLKSYCSKLSNGGVQLIYDDPEICNGTRAGQTVKPPQKPCRIVICYETICKRPSEAGDAGGDPSIPPLMFNVLHEFTHCCGLQHAGPKDAECNDIWACCIYNIIHNGNTKNCKRNRK